MSLEVYRNKETRILELFTMDEDGDFVDVSGDFISPCDIVPVLNEALTKAMDNANKLVDLEQENEKLKNVALDLLAIEESYEAIEELGDNFYEYIDKVRPFLETLKTISINNSN